MNKEVKGRILLFKYAVNESLETLSLALKYRDQMQSTEKNQELNDWIQGRNEFCIEKMGGNTDNGIKMTPEWEKEYADSNPMAFPNWFQCNDTYGRLVLLSVVLFSQAFNKGFPDQGVVVGNFSEEINRFREHVLRDAFNESEKAQFLSLKETLNDHRDQMIAHADGSAFDLQHGSGFISHSGYRAILSRVDLDLWLVLLKKYNLSVRKICRFY